MHTHVTPQGFIFLNFDASPTPVPFAEHFGHLTDEWKFLNQDEYECVLFILFHFTLFYFILYFIFDGLRSAGLDDRARKRSSVAPPIKQFGIREGVQDTHLRRALGGLVCVLAIVVMLAAAGDGNNDLSMSMSNSMSVARVRMRGGGGESRCMHAGSAAPGACVVVCASGGWV